MSWQENGTVWPSVKTPILYNLVHHTVHRTKDFMQAVPQTLSRYRFSQRQDQEPPTVCKLSLPYTPIIKKRCILQRNNESILKVKQKNNWKKEVWIKRKGADPVSEFVTKIKNKNVSQQRLQEISETAERLENQSEIHAYSSKCKKMDS